MQQLLVGFGAWYGTGVDDLIVLIGFVLACTNRSEKVLVALGTLLGVVIMLASAVLVPVLTKNFPLDQWVRLTGVIPIYLGVKTLTQALRPNGSVDQNGRVHSQDVLFTSAMITYLGNGTDDWLVMTSLFVSANPLERWMLAVGDLAGCISSIALAAGLSRVLRNHKSRMRSVAGVILILIGVRILIG